MVGGKTKILLKLDTILLQQYLQLNFDCIPVIYIGGSISSVAELRKKTQ